jgi:hypothetical protein
MFLLLLLFWLTFLENNMFQSKLYGAIVHGHFSAAYVYPDYQEGGSNVTIEVIHRTIEAYVKGDPATGRLPKKLPPTLYLQLDNTFK